MNTKTTLFAVTALATLLAGCGGGGGGSTASDSIMNDPIAESPNPQPINQDVVVPENSKEITAENGISIAQVSMDVFNTLKGVSSVANTGAIHLTGDDLNPGPRVITLASSCREGGQVRVSGETALMKSVQTTYQDCTLNGAVYNGQLSIQFVTVIARPGDSTVNWSYSGEVAATDFRVTVGERQISLSGNFHLTAVHTANTEIPGGFTIRFQGTNDEVVMLREGEHATRLKKFDLIWGYRNFQPSRYAASIDGARLASTRIDGQVTLENDSTYGGYDAGVPGSGALRIYGANSSNLKIDAIGSDAVQVEIDRNGNGSLADNGDRVYNGMWRDTFARW